MFLNYYEKYNENITIVNGKVIQEDIKEECKEEIKEKRKLL